MTAISDWRDKDMDIENKYGTLEMQKQLLVLMRKFDEFCSNNNLNYSMGGGSMLGAIREKGFIPWDDDLDINVDRMTYNSLISLLSNSSVFKLERLLWIYRVRLADSVKIDDGSIPTLDIFVVDNAPDNKCIRKAKVFFIKTLQGMLKEGYRKESFSIGYRILLDITRIMGFFFTRDFKLRLYDFISQWGNGRETQYVTIYNDLFKCLNNLYECNLMKDFIRVPFENIEVSVSTGFHNFLLTHYGDYMTPPKQEDRIPQHMKLIH